MAIDEDDEEDTKGKKSDGNLKLIIILVSAFFILFTIIITLVLVLLLKGDKAPPQPTAAVANAQPAKADAEEAAEAKEEEAVEEEEEEEEPEEQAEAIYFSIKPAFVVNFRSNGKLRFLQVSVDVMARDQGVIDIVKSHMPRIKNDLIALFGSQSVAELNTYEGREKLRERAQEVINKIVSEVNGSGGVESVLFTSFVMQ